MLDDIVNHDPLPPVIHAESDNIRPKNPADYNNTGRYEPPESPTCQGITINPIAINKDDATIVNDPTTPHNNFDDMINSVNTYFGAHEDLRTAAKKAKHLQVDNANTG